MSEQYPRHAPIWLELAEAALGARRREEALHAGRRALELDRHCFSRFSPALRQVCEHLMFNANADRDPAPAPASFGSSGQPKRPGAYGRVGNGREIGQLAVEIAKARALKGTERRRKLEDLTRKHPDQGRAWLALAEENLEGRRIEEAMAAAERALALDSDLDRNLSPKLERALRYHKAGMDPLSPSHRDKAAAYRQRNKPQGSQRSRGSAPSLESRKGPRATPAKSRPAPRPTPDPKSQHIARPAPVPPTPPTPPNANARALEIHREVSRRRKRPSQRHDPGNRPSVGKHLAQALEIEDRNQRLRALRAIKDMAPDNSAVLFHFAIEAALAGEIDEAQRAGRVLRRIAPQRYEQLYALAESYWPSGGASQPRNDAQAKPQLEVVSTDIEPEDMFGWAPSNAKTGFYENGDPMQIADTALAPAPAPAPMPVAPPAAPAVKRGPHTMAMPSARGVMPDEPSPMLIKPLQMPSLPPPAPSMPTPARVEPIRNPAALAGPPMPMSPPPQQLAATPVRVWSNPKSNKPKSRLRTAGALAAGVAAGLLFAVILVFVLSRFDAVETSHLPSSPADTALSMGADAAGATNAMLGGESIG